MVLTVPEDNLSEASSTGSSSWSESDDSSLPEVSSSPSLSSSKGLAGLRLAEEPPPSVLEPSVRRSVFSDSENER